MAFFNLKLKESEAFLTLNTKIKPEAFLTLNTKFKLEAFLTLKPEYELQREETFWALKS